MAKIFFYIPSDKGTQSYQISWPKCAGSCSPTSTGSWDHRIPWDGKGQQVQVLRYKWLVEYIPICKSSCFLCPKFSVLSPPCCPSINYFHMAIPFFICYCVTAIPSPLTPSHPFFWANTKLFFSEAALFIWYSSTFAAFPTFSLPKKPPAPPEKQSWSCISPQISKTQPWGNDFSVLITILMPVDLSRLIRWKPKAFLPVSSQNSPLTPRTSPISWWILYTQIFALVCSYCNYLI